MEKYEDVGSNALIAYDATNATASYKGAGRRGREPEHDDYSSVRARNGEKSAGELWSPQSDQRKCDKTEDEGRRDVPRRKGEINKPDHANDDCKTGSR